MAASHIIDSSDWVDVVLPEDEVARVRAFWQQLGLPGLVDIHTHFMPRQVIVKVWGYFGAVGERTGTEWPIGYPWEEPARVERLRAFGLRAFSSMLYPHKPGMAGWLNDWARDFADTTPDCLHTATFFPEPSAAQYVPKALADGARIFKSHLEVGGYNPNDQLLDPVWGALRDAQVPVVIHAGSGPAPGRHTGPEPIAVLLERFQGLVLVIAHMGMPEYAEFLDLADRHANVHLDTTMAFTDFTEAMAPFPVALRPRLVEHADRILLGSDFPHLPYPYLHQLEALARLDLGEGWLRGVLHDNACRLMGLPPH